MVRAVIVALVLFYARPAATQPVPAPPPSGAYEAIAPHLGVPVGPLPPKTGTTLPRWLEVTTDGAEATVVVWPEGRIRFELRYGPHGLTDKRVRVDGTHWTHSVFAYGPDGHLRAKRVTGAGIDPKLGDAVDFSYATDDHGRIVERQSSAAGDPTIRWRYDTGGATETQLGAAGEVLRVTRYDPDGRVREIQLGPDAGALSLIWRRTGGAIRILRRLPGGVVQPAIWDRPREDLTPAEVRAIPRLTERHVALLALGAPRTGSVDDKPTRSRTDDYSTDCWLNEPSALVYDAADVTTGYRTSCICGFCVGAGATLQAEELIGTDTHWTTGPWVRLDGIEITADHLVMTPDGPRPAGRLKPGDMVLDAAGAPRPLGQVDELPQDVLRLGVNLRTASGTFSAGDLTVVSELPRACVPAGERSLAE